MRKIQKLFIISLLVLMNSCQSSLYRPVRVPAAVGAESESLKVLKLRNTELSAMSIHFRKKKNEIQLAKIKNEQNDLEKKINELEFRIQK